MIDRLGDVVNDFRLSWDDRDFWYKYALADVSRIYARTRFGIVWEIFGPAVFVFGIGLSYSRLIGYEVSLYLPHLAIGYIIWLNMQMHVVGSGRLFIKYRTVLLGSYRPICSYIFRHYVATMMYSLVHLVMIIPIVLIFFGNFQNFRILWFLSYFVLFNISAFSLTIVISVLCLRVRDIPPLLEALNRLAFFITPIIWMERNLGYIGGIIIKLNPYAYFLVGIRNAMLGKEGDVTGLGIVSLMTFVLVISAILVLAWAKPKITRWL